MVFSVAKILLLFLLLGWLAGCSCSPYVIQPKQTPDNSPANRIYVVSHGWHTGLVVPASRLNQALPGLARRFGNSVFYEIGWGDKGFYQAKEITTGLTLQAMLWATGAIVHVVAVPRSPYESFPHSQVSDACVSEAELDSLITFLASSFSHDKSGQIIPLARGIYGDAHFYEGTGRYYLLNTCNKWTAKGLSSAGYDISPTFKLTAGSIMNYLAHHRRACPPSNSLLQASDGSVIHAY
ncbi:MAG: TIGR02117 family protein [Candidatus Competibacteraceae bacterium]|nr:TIGR02117 family protein [Candidatus Competibacteraceae bacterium]